MDGEKKKEKIFYSGSTVLVSESKVIMGGNAIRIENIESAKVAKSVKRVREGIIMALVGGIVLIIGISTAASVVSILGGVFIALGIISLAIAYIKPMYYVRLKTANGYLEPYCSDNIDEVREIVLAIEQAIEEFHSKIE